MYSASRFLYRPADAASGHVVRLTGQVSSRQELFDVLVQSLHFPDYFGDNWDALIDCLSDLSWLESDVVSLVHERLPSLPPNELKTYLECLQDVLSRKERGDRPILRILFQEADFKRIQELLERRSS